MPRPRKALEKVPREARQARANAMVEYAAFCAVLMENDEYQYAKDEHRQFDPDGNTTWNKSVLQRLAGYSDRDFCLDQDPLFLRMVEYHRRRRVDPSFTNRGAAVDLFNEIGNESLLILRDRLLYSPDSVSTSEVARILKVVTDFAISGAKLGDQKSELKKINAQLGDSEVLKLLEERKRDLEKKLDKAYSEQLAREGADYIAEVEDDGDQGPL